MGLNITQKIISNHIKGRKIPTAGEEIAIKIDQCLTQDSTGTMAWLEFESLGLKKVKAKTVVSYVDHTNLEFKGESSEDHLFLQTAASHFGAIFSKASNGVCHQIHYERFAKPGETLLGSDSHTPTSGALGMIAIGVGGMDVAVAMAGGSFYLNMPKVVKVNLTGKLKWGSSAKDIILEILKKIKVKGGRGKILEYSGLGIKTLSVPQRATICNMGAETGATTSIFPSDEITKQFLYKQKRLNDFKYLIADNDAIYDDIININLSLVVPQVAMPGSPDNVKIIDEVKGTKLNQIFIGSCTNGSWQEFYMAAQMLKGKKVSPNIEVMIVPGSRQVLEKLISDGSLEILIKAGCRIQEPGCGPCIGMGFVPGDGYMSLRTVNRNWEGRGGNKFGKIILASPEIAVASALTGVISDPRKLPKIKIIKEKVIIDDSLLIKPKRQNIIRGKNIISLKPQKPIPKTIQGKVVLKLDSNISTDDILPAGPLTQHLRSNLPEISKYAFYYKDPLFVKRAEESKSGIIIADENYGQGSSREHAALVCKELQIKAVLAKSFARIHRTNLINNGIIPLILTSTTKLNINDKLIINLKDLGNLVVQNLTKKTSLKVTHNLSQREIDIVFSGGILAYTKAYI